MKLSRMAPGSLLLFAVVLIAACASTEPMPPPPPPPPPPPGAADCGTGAVSGPRNIQVEVVGGRVKLVNTAEDRVLANPEIDAITWELRGESGYEILITFDNPRFLEARAGSSRKQKQLKQKQRASDCDEFKYTISVSDPSVAPLDPVIIVKY